MTDDASHQECQGQVNPPLPEGIQIWGKVCTKSQLSPSQSAGPEAGLAVCIGGESDCLYSDFWGPSKALHFQNTSDVVDFLKFYQTLLMTLIFVKNVTVFVIINPKKVGTGCHEKWVHSNHTCDLLWFGAVSVVMMPLFFLSVCVTSGYCSFQAIFVIITTYFENSVLVPLLLTDIWQLS